ncbi:uncharacterized protein LOC131070879 [Cryptomeria japonica]|uniref:uncharacterized protein LOC131070879 n=1 Tax=Cryptomeria japonica TaxID=3369 RepID=UPI0025ABAD06|nr:uncharacterized protein LOC131070879 [Cryptomeria japonica]
MDLALRGTVGRYIIVYLDDLTIFSKDCENHLFHLKDVLERYRKHNISLNPKKLFFGRFIPDFAEKTRHIMDMMKGKTAFHWNSEGKVAFNDIKDAIAHAPILKNSEEIESPIDFMSCPLKSHELKYYSIEKNAYAVVKAVKNFHFYIPNSHTVVLVTNTSVKSILTQQEFGTKKGN